MVADIAVPVHSRSERHHCLFSSSSQIPVDFWLCPILHCTSLQELVVSWGGFKWEEELWIGKKQRKHQPLSQRSHNMKDLWLGVEPKLLWCPLGINWGVGECKEQKMPRKRGEEEAIGRARCPSALRYCHLLYKLIMFVVPLSPTECTDSFLSSG